MASSGQSKRANKKAVEASRKASNAIGRIGDLEQGFVQLAEGLQKVVDSQTASLEDQGETLAAIVDLLGEDQVKAKIKEKRQAKIMAAVEKAKANLAVGIAEGRAKPVDFVTENAIIVGKEFDDKGEVRFPGRLQAMVGQLTDEVKEAIMGKPAGFAFTLKNGSRLEVNEVYEVVQVEETSEKTA